LNAERRRRFAPAAQSNHGLPVYENLLNRDFGAAEPGRKWASNRGKSWIYPVLFMRLPSADSR
jgi:transposase InsO family protein